MQKTIVFQRLMTPAVLELVNAYGRFKQHNIMPRRGGWDNQPAVFCEVTEWLDRRLAWIEEDKKKRRESLKVKED